MDCSEMDCLWAAMERIAQVAEIEASNICEAAKKMAELFGISVEVAKESLERLSRLMDAVEDVVEKIKERYAERKRFTDQRRAEERRRRAWFRRYERVTMVTMERQKMGPQRRAYKPP